MQDGSMKPRDPLAKRPDPSEVVDRKRKALGLFADHLLSSPAGPYVAKMILFGSLRKGTPGLDSDVDLLILATEQLDRVEIAAAESALEVGLASGESIEPVVYPLTELRHSTSYFTYYTLLHGEDIYSMEETRIKQEESKGYFELAGEYLDGALDSLTSSHPRLAVDAAYNAAELCAKGLLLFELDELPSSHGGVVVKFAELFVKDGPLSRTLGRSFHRALALRNKSRYDRSANIGPQEAEEVIKLAEEMISFLEVKLAHLSRPESP